MRGPVAGHAVRCVRVVGCEGFSVNALPEFLYFIGVALRAFCRRRLGCRSHLVRIAVAGLASSVAQRGMNAAGEMGSLAGVAGRALNLNHFIGVRIFLNGRVAVSAAQDAVHAGRMSGGFN